MDSAALLEVYRRDRRALLGFILSSAGGRAVDLSRVDLDAVSADYALGCVASGVQFDASEATRRYFDERRYPIMMGSPSVNSYFLLSRPERSGSPPNKAAPDIVPQAPAEENPTPIREHVDFFRAAINILGTDNGTKDVSLADIYPKQVNKMDILSLGLPKLSTELSDDDIRETAYEVLLASLFVSGKILFSEEKKEKKPKFLKGLRSKTEVSNPSPQPENHYSQLLDLIRVQMEARQMFSKNYFSSQDRVSMDWVVSVPDGPVEVLTIIERYNAKLCEAPKKFNLKGETYHWIQSYHLNFRLYEKLLCIVFDILEDGQLVEEADEILETVKLTWTILGITQKLHDTLFAWVLFKKFAETGEILLLKHTCLQTQKLRLHNDAKEIELYTNSFVCSAEACGGNMALSLVDSAILKINKWCFRQLENYHSYFNKVDNSIFEGMLNLVVISETSRTDDDDDDDEKAMLIGTPLDATQESKLIHILVVRSIQAAYKHALISSDCQSKAEFKHPLIILANELKLVAEKECTIFSPTLCKRYPEAGRVALVLLHLLYGQQLELFLERMDNSESLKEILAATNNFELCVAKKLYLMNEGAVGSLLSKYLKPYMISQFSSPLILQWLHVQHENVLEWTKRIIEIEDWEPLSAHERHATSVVEVFRIVEETIEQFFNSSLPLDTVHLRSLLIGITSSLQVYLHHMENQQVPRATLLPSAPVLTRYAESVNPFAKRKLIVPTVPEEKVANKLNNLTVPKLCAKLNTLQFIRDQLDNIEEGIKQSWVSVQSAVGLLDYLSCIASGQTLPKNLSSEESIDELFTIFDDVRRTAVSTTDRILNFIGTRAVFWDMRDSLLFSLYRASVESARMEMFIPTIDQVLDQVCDLIVDALRDQVVLRVFQACMEGLIWILLDGGPSRAFLETDVDLMHQDLAMIKDLFIAEGQGLPLDLVEKEARLTHQILDLFVLKKEKFCSSQLNENDFQADTIIDMLINVSDQLPHHLELTTTRRRHVHDAHTLLRVLCHKKDKTASTFLKIQYHLPRSSDYDDISTKNAPSKAPMFSDMLKKLDLLYLGLSTSWELNIFPVIKEMKHQILRRI
uniref:MHD1 domain-containing protein n=1 Tax=Oryza nivara TaxID=4536 RepID=A0A0E0H4J7_ORYNI